MAIPGLGDIDVPYEGSVSGDIGIAIRPEKLRVTSERPPDPCIAFPGDTLILVD